MVRISRWQKGILIDVLGELHDNNGSLLGDFTA